jgi:transposase
MKHHELRPITAEVVLVAHGRGGAALEPLYELRKAFVLSSRVLHADETPVAMLDPGAGKTKRAYV